MIGLVVAAFIMMGVGFLGSAVVLFHWGREAVRDSKEDIFTRSIQ